jgi:hypothetical protein
MHREWNSWGRTAVVVSTLWPSASIGRLRQLQVDYHPPLFRRDREYAEMTCHRIPVRAGAATHRASSGVERR